MSERSNERKYEFGFNNQLPRVFELVNAIVAVEPAAAYTQSAAKESVNSKTVVHAAALAMQKLWGEAFSSCHVKSLTGIKKHIKGVLAKFSNFMKNNRGKNKISKREKFKLWRLQNSVLFNCFSRSMNETKLQELENFEVEKLFYADQIGPRLMYLDEEIDEEYEEKRTEWLNQKKKEAEQYEAEMTYIFNDDVDDTEHLDPTFDEAPQPSSSTSSQPLTAHQPLERATRSGLILPSNNLVSAATQVGFHVSPQPPTRHVKVCTEDIKSALAAMTVAGQTSPEKAKRSAQAFAKHFYHHDYYLSPKEKDPSYESKRPRTAADYAVYADVFPDDKTIANYKHSQALQMEQHAAHSLKNKTPSQKTILHFDTTKRSRIEGDWPALILNTRSPPNKCEKFTLRPLFFAMEDRENISRLIVETLERLAITVSLTARLLWEKIDGFMTDSVTKNLNVEYLVAEKLSSSHIPLHFLCNSHTSEKFDEMILSVLVTIEKQISLREKLESSNPQLKSFYRGKKCIVECALTALCKLISADKSANSASLSDEFDMLVETVGMVKLITMYQERKFTKLGTTCACVVKSLGLYERLLEETPKNNLLVKACRLYINCEYIICAMKCLAYFTYKVGMPFLNMCELSSQRDMKHRLPAFYEELKGGNLDCLLDYHVVWNRITIEKPDSELGTYILKNMCMQAAEGLRIQRGREYGFYGEEFTQRATNVSQLPDDDLELFPSHNLDCERHLSVAGVFMELGSKCSNKNFRARCVRDNVILHHSSEVKKLDKKLQALLDQRENVWDASQREIKMQHLKSLMEKGKNREIYIDKVLAKCKTWGGPFLKMDEVKVALEQEDEDGQKRILRHEITFQRSTHPNDALLRKELYLINKQSVGTMTENLCILLNGDLVREENDGEVFLPTEAEVMSVISITPAETETETITTTRRIAEIEEPRMQINELCAVMWEYKGKMNWYLGYILEIDSEFAKIEHLERVDSLSDQNWQYPTLYTDIQDGVSKEQILPVMIKSDWDYSNDDKSVLEVKNIDEINKCFTEFA